MEIEAKYRFFHRIIRKLWYNHADLRVFFSVQGRH